MKDRKIESQIRIDRVKQKQNGDRKSKKERETETIEIEIKRQSEETERQSQIDVERRNNKIDRQRERERERRKVCNTILNQQIVGQILAASAQYPHAKGVHGIAFYCICLGSNTPYNNKILRWLPKTCHGRQT